MANDQLFSAQRKDVIPPRLEQDMQIEMVQRLYTVVKICNQRRRKKRFCSFFQVDPPWIQGKHFSNSQQGQNYHNFFSNVLILLVLG